MAGATSLRHRRTVIAEGGKMVRIMFDPLPPRHAIKQRRKGAVGAERESYKSLSTA
jgi:hypothetical protein